MPPPGGALLLRAEGRSVGEVLAGITLVALSLPMNIGYATVAGLPATVGVYASIVPVLVFAIAALVIADGVLISQKEGRRHGEEIAPYDEVFAYGMSNVASALFGRSPAWSPMRWSPSSICPPSVTWLASVVVSA